MNNYFTITYSESIQPKTEHFELHYHDGYEFLLFFKGDSEYIVEGNNYTLNSLDAVVIKRYEMHRIFHHSNSVYKRFVININPEFFHKFHCKEYENIFTDNVFNGNNKILAKDIKESGLFDIINSIIKYSDGGKNIDKPVVRAAVIEFLYVLNNIKNFSESEKGNTQIRNIISYINDHYKEDISLDTLSSLFFISKYHLCRSFKESTGYTVHNFINQKRLSAVKNLCKSGIPIGEACTSCGFSDYSSFYRFYIKENGVSPKKDLK